MSDPVILAFDTRGAFCDACILSQGVVLHQVTESMVKGQAERLMPLLQELLDTCGMTYADLDRIGVGIGPGNFTGVRIAVSAARGLALGLGVPAIGVNALDAQSYKAVHPHYSILTATRTGDIHRVYWQKMDGSGEPPQFGVLEDVPDDLPFIGPRDGSLLTQMPEVHAIAHIAAAATAPFEKPKPLYIKPADAAPPREKPPVILP